MKNMKQGGIPNLTARYAAKYDEAKLKAVVFDHYTDPYMVFSDFFAVSNIKEHLLGLKKMYKCATALMRIKTAPANVIYGRELFSVVLNATWVIDQTGVKFSQLEARELYRGRSGGVLSNEKAADYLTDAEINDPYLGIKNVFKKTDLHQCHVALNEWLKMALCKNEFEADYKGRRKLYKCIAKVLICCWLIYEREIVSPEV
ncbi:hypothetical protein [Pedobacter nanyangensis]|uniref:hypothetical protein n=1 Tax=Pedobacter nanyangensis TaxID=1562389 RepID=UPI000DE41D5B|nr:hypothetical protein [Pedobacter nanyangensis]